MKLTHYSVRFGAAIAFVFLLCCGRTKGEKSTDAVQGTETVPLTDIQDPASAPSPCMVSGQEVYSQYCLVCHQVKGGGVRGLNPPLSGTDYVLGDPGRLISILIEGSNVGLEVNGATYSNAMPGFSYLSDDEIACVATYIRNSFGNSASAVSTAEVRALRHPEP